MGKLGKEMVQLVESPGGPGKGFTVFTSLTRHLRKDGLFWTLCLCHSVISLSPWVCFHP
jgi:hypothetical protein